MSQTFLNFPLSYKKEFVQDSIEFFWVSECQYILCWYKIIHPVSRLSLSLSLSIRTDCISVMHHRYTATKTISSKCTKYLSRGINWSSRKNLTWNYKLWKKIVNCEKNLFSVYSKFLIIYSQIWIIYNW